MTDISQKRSFSGLFWGNTVRHVAKAGFGGKYIYFNFKRAMNKKKECNWKKSMYK